MLTTIISTVLAMVWPQAPAWVSVFIGAVVPVVFEVVEELDDMADLEGPAKFRLAVATLGDAMDEAFDSIPEWSELGEKKRDRIIKGLVELAVFVQRLSTKNGKRSARRQVRTAARLLRGR